MTTRKQLEKEARALGLTGLGKYKSKKALIAAIVNVQNAPEPTKPGPERTDDGPSAKKPEPKTPGKKCSACRHDPGRGEDCQKTGKKTPILGCGYWRKRL